MNIHRKCKFVSFNCQGLKRSMECIRYLCKSADVIALQETWLLPHDIPILGDVHDDFAYTGVSAVDTSEGVLRGRPYGGVAILWRKSVFRDVSVIKCSNNRVVAVKVQLYDRSFILCSVYMPTDSIQNLPDFTDCLGILRAIIESGDSEAIYVLGDFNAHPGELFDVELANFCTENEWFCVDKDKLGKYPDTFTFISQTHGSLRWLDHCIVTKSALQTISEVRVDYNVFVSDHFPLEVTCNLLVIPPKLEVEFIRCNKVIWGERDSCQISIYSNLCHNRLRNIDYSQ